MARVLTRAALVAVIVAGVASATSTAGLMRGVCGAMAQAGIHAQWGSVCHITRSR